MKLIRKKTQQTCPWMFPRNDISIYDSELVTSEQHVEQHTTLRSCCLFEGKKRINLLIWGVAQSYEIPLSCCFLPQEENLFSKIHPCYTDSILKSALQPGTSKQHLWSCACTLCWVLINQFNSEVQNATLFISELQTRL